MQNKHVHTEETPDNLHETTDQNQGPFPAEVLQHIFSFTNRRTVQAGRCASRFFRDTLSDKAIAIRIIENDLKYLPDITYNKLMSSVCMNGRALHFPARSAIAFRPFTNTHINGQTDYKFYEMLIAGKHYNPDTELTEWGIDSTGLLRVCPQGQITFHSIDEVNNGILNNILTHHSPDVFLNHPNPQGWKK